MKYCSLVKIFAIMQFDVSHFFSKPVRLIQSTRCARRSTLIAVSIVYLWVAPRGNHYLVDLSRSVFSTSPKTGVELIWSGCVACKRPFLRKQLELVC